MSHGDVHEAVLKVVRRYSTYQRDLVSDARLIEDLGIDSLTLLTVVSEVEVVLDVRFPADVFSEANMSTVGGLTRLAVVLVKKTR